MTMNHKIDKNRGISDGTNWALNRGNGRRRGEPSLPRSNSATALSGAHGGGGRKYSPQKSKGVADKKPRGRGSGGSVRTNFLYIFTLSLVILMVTQVPKCYLIWTFWDAGD